MFQHYGPPSRHARIFGEPHSDKPSPTLRKKLELMKRLFPEFASFEPERTPFYNDEGEDPVTWPGGLKVNDRYIETGAPRYLCCLLSRLLREAEDELDGFSGLGFTRTAGAPTELGRLLKEEINFEGVWPQLEREDPLTAVQAHLLSKRL